MPQMENYFNTKRVAVTITLTDDERTIFAKWWRERSTAPELGLHAKIMVAAAETRENIDVAEELVCMRRTAGL